MLDVSTAFGPNVRFCKISGKTFLRVKLSNGETLYLSAYDIYNNNFADMNNVESRIEFSISNFIPITIITDVIQSNYIWVTESGIPKFIMDIDNTHLNNIYKMKRKLVDSYLIGSALVNSIEKELKRRKIKLLIDK